MLPVHMKIRRSGQFFSREEIHPLDLRKLLYIFFICIFVISIAFYGSVSIKEVSKSIPSDQFQSSKHSVDPIDENLNNHLGENERITDMENEFGATMKGDFDEQKSLPLKQQSKSPEENTLLGIYRTLFPLLAGFSFGFAGSIPVAGPTSAMVLKLGIQGKYWAGHAVALGGATAEAAYAGVAFWGFGSFLANLHFLLPISKIFGSLILLAIGITFLRFEVRPQVEQENDVSSIQSNRVDNQHIFLKNVLLGFTMSGVNPALLATYTGAIATVGVCSGISLWFFLLLRFLKRHKQRIKNQTLGVFMRCMGIILICVGLGFTKASYDYFVQGAAMS